MLHRPGGKLSYVFIMDRNRINSDCKGKVQFGHDEKQISCRRVWSVFMCIKALVFDLVPVLSLQSVSR